MVARLTIATRRRVWPTSGSLALVALGAGILRFVGLAKESIWLDEATSIIIARMDLASVVAWAAGDIHPPLYYLALHLWLGLGDSEFSVRALSALFGVLTVVIVYALGRELFSPRVGLLSALLLGLSPLHIWYSQETRMYVMVTMLGLLASYVLLLALRRQQQGYWLGYAVVSALALYTHYFALFVLLFQGLFAIYWLWRHGSRSLWCKWLMANLAIVLRRVAYGVFGVCLAVVVSRLAQEREREAVLFCLMYVAVPLLTAWLLSQAKPMYTIRYLLPFLPAYCILVAAGIDGLRWDGVRFVVTLALVGVLLFGDWSAWRTEQNPDWRGLTSHILEQAQAGDVVLFSPRWNVKPFEFYARGRVEINMDLPIPVTEEAARRVVADVTRRHERVWLVWERGHYSDPGGIVKQMLDGQFVAAGEQAFRGTGELRLYDLTTAVTES